MTRQEYIEVWRSYANNKYFYGHEAKKQMYGDEIYAIDWRDKNGSRINYVRYFFDGNALYITGDLGEAIFQCSSGEPVSKWLVEKLCGNYSLSYCLEKMRCSRDEKEHIDRNVWEHDFVQWIDKEDPSEKVAELVKELFNKYGEGGYEQAVMWNDELGEKYDLDTVEEISCFGLVPSTRAILWLEGLKMAFKQLEK
jgi:hypothetical protein